jgi:hypothetical protein
VPRTMKCLTLCTLLALAALVLAVPVAGQAQPSRPNVDDIWPLVATSGTESIVEVKGDHLPELPEARLVRGEKRIPLTATWLSSSRIDIVIPEEAEVGDYELELELGALIRIWDFSIISPVVNIDIDNVQPDTFWNKEDVELAVSGKGFSSITGVRLGMQRLFQFELTSDTQLTVTVPSHFPAGSHTLRLDLRADEIPYEPEITVLEYITPTISPNGISPSVLYNNEHRQLEVVGEGFGDLDSVHLGPQGLYFSFRSPMTITAVIKAGFPPGPHPLVLGFTHGERITAEQQIEVKPPIEASISKIEPDAIMQGQGAEITIFGENLELAQRITVDGYTLGEGDFSVSEDEAGEKTLKYHTPEGFTFGVEADYEESYKVTIQFPDGSTKGEDFTIYEELSPSSSSWFGLAFYLSALALASFYLYRGVIRRSEPHRLNKESPGPMGLVGIVIGVLSIAVVLGLLWFALWGATGPGAIRFIAVWLLAGSAVALAWIGAHWTGHFDQIWPDTIRAALALALSAVALSAPFLFNNADWIRWSVWFEAMLILVITAIGIASTIVIDHKLAEERAKGPSEDEIYRQAVQILRRQGQVSAEMDFPDFPWDKVNAVLKRYWSEYQEEQNLDYVEDEAKLSFQRKAAVALFQTALSNLRSLIRSTPLDPKEVEDASEQLASAIRTGFGFVAGEPFQIRSPSSKLHVFSHVSPKLESVLPTPFPFMVFGSNAAITSEEMRQLRTLQNRIGQPQRFAVLLPTSYADESRRLIHEELGGMARENIAVLGDDDVVNILVGKEALAPAFMQALGDQIELLIFSPYQVKGPTNPDMFFGRGGEIARILESIGESSVVVLGARRMGKTSVLHFVARILEERGSLLLYLNGDPIADYDSFFAAMATSWQPRFPELNLEGYASINGFARFVSDLAARDPEIPIVFQFDEVDLLLKYDAGDGRNELLFRMFRSLAQQQRCQFIFSGERTLLDKQHDPQSRFFNFTKPVELRLFDLKVTSDLVQRPMSLVQIGLENPDQICTMIFEETSGHPNLIQYICDALLTQAGSADTRLITEEMVRHTVESPEYVQEYQSTFWSQATPLEKAASIVVSEAGSVGEGEILTTLRGFGFKVTMSEVQRGLRYLGLSQLLTSADGQYSIQPTQFARHLSALTCSQWCENFQIDWQRAQGGAQS